MYCNAKYIVSKYSPFPKEYYVCPICEYKLKIVKEEPKDEQFTKTLF